MPQNKKNKKNKKNKTKHPRQNEAGNVFIIILLGVALFAALSYTMSRGMRGENTRKMSEQQAVLKASTILDSGQKFERAVNRLRRQNISENDISFDQAIVAGYDHTPVQPDGNKVFHPNGGSVSWQSPPEDANDGSDWFFTGETCIADLGSGATGCDTDGSTRNEELVAVLPNIDEAVCTEINDKLGITDIPADTGGGASTTLYQGDFDDGTEIILTGGPFEAACFSRGGNNFFYQVLIAR